MGAMFRAASVINDVRGVVLKALANTGPDTDLMHVLEHLDEALKTLVAAGQSFPVARVALDNLRELDH
jgi:hypothetical protein